MIDLIRKQLPPQASVEERIHYLREFLQVLLLKILYDTEAFKHLAFVGGTALRVLYDLNRFSEDLDFCLIEKKGYVLAGLLEKLRQHLNSYSLSADFNVHEAKTVQIVMIRFRHLLPLLGLSPLKDQKLSIHLEIDTDPPQGWKTEVSTVQKQFLFTVTHFDIPSLYATKLHACFYRRYTKGRDFYDLVWYLGKRAIPNFELLNHAVEQTQNVNPGISPENFQDFLRSRLEKIDFEKVRTDVERFLADKNEAKLLNRDSILSLLR